MKSPFDFGLRLPSCGGHFLTHAHAVPETCRVMLQSSSRRRSREDFPRSASLNVRICGHLRKKTQASCPLLSPSCIFLHPSPSLFFLRSACAIKSAHGSAPAALAGREQECLLPVRFNNSPIVEFTWVVSCPGTVAFVSLKSP